MYFNVDQTIGKKPLTKLMKLQNDVFSIIDSYMEYLTKKYPLFS